MASKKAPKKKAAPKAPKVSAVPRGQDEVFVQLATRIPKQLHRDLKLHCVQSDVSVMEFVILAIEAGLKAKTAKAA